MRLVVFLKQNSLTARSLIEKLIQTEISSKSNKGRISKTEKQAALVSINFFAKFIKAKVDKKRDTAEIKALVQMIDVDRDGVISETDLDAFLGRVNFHDFFQD